MAFDINTAKPVASGFDINTAKPVSNEVASPESSAGNPDVPSDDNPLYNRASADNETSFLDVAKGVGEAALTTGTGIIAGAPGYLIGGAQDIAEDLLGMEDRKLREQYSRAGTYEPKTDTGRDIVSGIGEAVGALPPVMSGVTPGAMSVSKANFQTPVFNKLSSPLAKKVAENNKIQKSFAKKTSEERFEPRIWGMVKEARKQGFDEGMTAMIANATPLNKRRMLQQVIIREKGMNNPKYKAKERPGDVVGKSLLREVDFIASNNKKAGEQLGRVSKSLNKKADVRESVQNFKRQLSNIGVSLDEGGVPDFTGSIIEFSATPKKLIGDILTKINRKKTLPTGREAHEFKKFLDESLTFGKKSDGGVSGRVESIVGNLRKGVNESINDISKSYKEANQRFSETKTVLDQLEGVVGKKLNVKGRYADKAFGQKLRTLLSNNDGRANMMTVVDDIRSVSEKYGGSFVDDILEQMLFADELDAVFDGAARTSLRGEMKKASVDAALDVSQMSIPGAAVMAAKAVNKKLQGVNQKNQLKAIKKLLTEKAK